MKCIKTFISWIKFCVLFFVFVSRPSDIFIFSFFVYYLIVICRLASISRNILSFWTSPLTDGSYSNFWNSIFKLYLHKMLMSFFMYVYVGRTDSTFSCIFKFNGGNSNIIGSRTCKEKQRRLAEKRRVWAKIKNYLWKLFILWWNAIQKTERFKCIFYMRIAEFMFFWLCVCFFSFSSRSIHIVEILAKNMIIISSNSNVLISLQGFGIRLVLWKSAFNHHNFNKYRFIWLFFSISFFGWN